MKTIINKLKKKESQIQDEYFLLILKLVYYLRENGFEIGVNQVENFIKILPSFDMFNKEDFISVAKCMFANNTIEYNILESHISKFLIDNLDKNNQNMIEECNEYYENMDTENKDKIDEKVNKMIDEDEIEKGNIDDSLLNKIRELAKEIDKEYLIPLIKADKNKILNELKTIENTANLKKDIVELMFKNKKEEDNSEINNILISTAKNISKLMLLREDNVNDLSEEVESLSNILEENKLSAIKEVIKATTFKHRKEFLGGSNAVKTLESILDKEISEYTEEDYKDIKKYIVLNASRFRTKTSNKNKRAKKEIIDLKKTINESIKTFGETSTLFYKKPIKSKTKVVCILDVSGSVSKSSKLFLQFIYEVSDVFRGGVKSFLFVKSVSNVTEHMKEHTFEDGFKLAMDSLPLRDYSDYGNAFRCFNDEHLCSIDKNTIVLIVGDARNNKNLSEVDVVKDIALKSKKTIWINTEDKAEWDKGDSIFSTYSKVVDESYEVTKFNELVSFIEGFTLE